MSAHLLSGLAYRGPTSVCVRARVCVRTRVCVRARVGVRARVSPSRIRCHAHRVRASLFLSLSLPPSLPPSLSLSLSPLPPPPLSLSVWMDKESESRTLFQQAFNEIDTDASKTISLDEFLKCVSRALGLACAGSLGSLFQPPCLLASLPAPPPAHGQRLKKGWDTRWTTAITSLGKQRGSSRASTQLLLRHHNHCSRLWQGKGIRCRAPLHAPIPLAPYSSRPFQLLDLRARMRAYTGNGCDSTRMRSAGHALRSTCARLDTSARPSAAQRVHVNVARAARPHSSGQSTHLAWRHRRRRLPRQRGRQEVEEASRA